MKMQGRYRLAVGADGSGTCAQAVIDASNFFSFEPAVAYTNNPGCPAMQRFRSIGVPVIELRPGDFPGRRAHEAALEERLNKHSFQAVVMLGDNRVKTKEFVEGYAAKEIPVLNTHPAPAPQFAGLKGYAWALGEHKQAVRRNEWTCVTFHRIDAEVDRGEIIAQCLVPMYDSDSLLKLKDRGLKIEHFQIVQCLEYLARGELAFDAERKRAEISDSRDYNVLFSSRFSPVEDLLEQGSGPARVGINTREGRWFYHDSSTEISQVFRQMPKNLAFTYSYRAVKGARLAGKQVDFIFDGLNIHPVIMKSSQERGETAY